MSTPNLDLSLPDDGDEDWGNAYRDAMTKIDTFAGQQEAIVSGQMLLDYSGRTDGSPIYLGRAPLGADINDPVWTITHFFWTSGADYAPLDHTEVHTSVRWTERASL